MITRVAWTPVVLLGWLLLATSAGCTAQTEPGSPDAGGTATSTGPTLVAAAPDQVTGALAAGGLDGCPFAGVLGGTVCSSPACAADPASDDCWEVMDATCEASPADPGCVALGLPGDPGAWECPFAGGPCVDPACEELTSAACSDAIDRWCGAHPEDRGCHAG